mgnify:CR=1 FL=1
MCVNIGSGSIILPSGSYEVRRQVNARHEYAILYNDSSVLESFHVSRAWRLMLTKGQDPFEGFAKEQYTEARQTIVTCILGTDMKFHFEHLTKFKSKIAGDGFADPTRVERKDTRLLLTMALHAADISNPAKPRLHYFEWTDRVLAEFYNHTELLGRAVDHRFSRAVLEAKLAHDVDGGVRVGEFERRPRG